MNADVLSTHKSRCHREWEREKQDAKWMTKEETKKKREKMQTQKQEQ